MGQPRQSSCHFAGVPVKDSVGVGASVAGVSVGLEAGGGVAVGVSVPHDSTSIMSRARTVSLTNKANLPILARLGESAKAGREWLHREL